MPNIYKYISFYDHGSDRSCFHGKSYDSNLKFGFSYDSSVVSIVQRAANWLWLPDYGSPSLPEFEFNYDVPLQKG